MSSDDGIYYKRASREKLKMTNDNQATDLYISKYCESRIQTIGRNIEIGVTQGWNKSEGGSGLLYVV